MNYISFRGVRTDSIGLYVQRMPAHKKAKQRYTEYEIPGRNGAVTITDGYAPFDLQAVVIMQGGDASLRQVINAWADGTGDLFTSDDTTRVWKASALREVQYARKLIEGKFYDTATVTWRCQPVMRERIPAVHSFTGSTLISNLGNVEAYPLIVVKGTGLCTLTIGNETITLEGVTEDVTIDSEAGYVYSASGAVAMKGEFPVLPLGATTLSFGGGVTNVTITPNWGWI